MPEYGLKMYNTLGAINLSSDSKAMRLHDSRYETIPARTGSLASPPIVEGSVLVSIVPVTVEAIIEVIDLESSLSTVDQLSVFVWWSTVVNNHWTKVGLYSYSKTTKDVMWKVWVHL